MRRQNHSCDQCRKAKRGCDAPSLKDALRRDSFSGSCRSDGDEEPECGPCSYCQRTNKQCTLNWARSQLAVAETAMASRVADSRRAIKRPRTDDPGPVATATQLPAVLPSPCQSAASVQQAEAETDAVATTVATTTAATTTTTVTTVPEAAAIFWDTSRQPPPFPPSMSALDTYQAAAATFSGSGYASDADLAALGFDPLGQSAVDWPTLPYHDPNNTLSAPPSSALAAITPMALPDNATAGIWGMLPPSTAVGDLDLAGQTLLDLSPQAVSGISPGEKATSPSPAFTYDPSLPRPPFPSGLEYAMAARVNNQNISENLLQIYHDVLEHNLSCWLTEETCPYSVISRRPRPRVARALPGAGRRSRGGRGGGRGGGPPNTPPDGNIDYDMSPSNMPQEIGPHWSNRMYHRIVKLDQIAQACGIVRLTCAQNQLSQRAFHLVIMAFATQWAQGSQRQRETYSTDFADAAARSAFRSAFPGSTAAPPTTSAAQEEFDRSLQRSLWEQARQALAECADVESFRVVCAELIFGLTQKPWSDAEAAGITADLASQTTAAMPPHAVRAFLLARIGDILARDGPPIFTERAARKMIALKSQVDSRAAGLVRPDNLGVLFSPSASSPPPPPPPPSSSSSSSSSSQPGATSAGIGMEERETVGLLHWLAVMFDTISSSLNERPVVVADEDSQHDEAVSSSDEDELDNPPSMSSMSWSLLQQQQQQQQQQQTYPRRLTSRRYSNRWRIDLFIQDNPERMAPPTFRWPCAYEDAARIVTRSAPVKVLLYRYVHYLQRMLRISNGCGGTSSFGFRASYSRSESIEETIRDTLLVYRYWNMTYGVFFQDVVERYATVPARIRGWSVCIVAHWHLAALMLADLLELVDANELGLPAARHIRLATHTVACIRKSSAAQLSDLARIATPLHTTFDPQLPDAFHFAVREGTILTEPWSLLLIRAFAKAAVLHLREADELRPEEEQQPQPPAHDSLRRCEECVQALWFLGKKSDMARHVAALVSQAMKV